MANFRAGGLASGLDTNTLISQLVNLERSKISALVTQKSDYKSQKSTYQSLNTRISNLKSTADDLDELDEFLEYSASSTDSNYITASASGEATPGSYDIVVESLAKGTKRMSETYSSQTESTGITGDLEINIDGATTTITLDSVNNSISGIVSSINSSSANVTASVFFDGTTYRIMLQGKDTGTDNAVTVTGDAGVSLQLDSEEPDHLIQSASNASFTVDGISVTSQSNTVSDVLDEITINLLKASIGTTTTITVAADNAAVQSKIQSLVSGINTAVSLIQTQFDYNGETKGRGSLNSDSLLRTIMSKFQSITSSEVSGLSGDYKSLSTIGIKTNSKTGQLEIDSGDLTDALNDDIEAVAQLFIESTSADGIAKQIYDLTDQITDSYEGLIKERMDGIDQSVGKIDDSIERETNRVEKFEEMLVKKFTNLESMVSKMQLQGTYLSAMT